MLIQVLWLILTVVHCQQFAFSGVPRESWITMGLKFTRQGDRLEAKKHYSKVLATDDQNALAWQLLAVVLIEEGLIAEAYQCYERAMDIGESAEILTNAVEVLRQLNRHQDALDVATRSLILDPSNAQTYYHMGLVYSSMNLAQDAIRSYKEALRNDPTFVSAAENLAIVLVEGARFEEAVKVLSDTSRMFKSAPCSLLFRIAVYTSHKNSETAYSRARQCIEASENSPENERMLSVVMNSMGALAQVRGDWLSAKKFYESSLSYSYQTSSMWANYGSLLWHTGFRNDALTSFFRAIALDINDDTALRLLGNWYYESGDLSKAALVFNRAAMARPDIAFGMKVRIACMSRAIMSPCSSAADFFLIHRSTIQLKSLVDEATRNVIENPVKEIERFPFYWMYHGANELSNQEMLSSIVELASHKFINTSHVFKFKRKNEQTKVGFISKFWHEEHPHSLLLLGVLQGIVNYFDISIYILRNPRGGPSQEILSLFPARMVYLIGDTQDAASTIRQGQLDMLVYVDTMSEPVTYCLSRFRLAPVQAAFWGNPVTTGSSKMDYFISGDWMEQDGAAHNHYSEQLVRLQGFGIHYKSHVRQVAQVPRSDQIRFSVLQSSFKLHPAFDLAVKEIMIRVPHARLALLTSREETWMKDLQHRLNVSWPSDVLKRTYYLPRVYTEKEFLRMMLEHSDIVLHPFPFGGSKTSADALSLGIPMVVMRGSYLRGRMAYALYKQMGLMDLVANNANEYVDIAVRLARDNHFRKYIGSQIVNRVHRIFDDEVTVSQWRQFIQRVIRASRQEIKAVLVEKANHLMDEGQVQASLSVFESVLDISDAMSHNNFAAALLRQNDPQFNGRVLQHFEKALELEPLNLVFRNNYGVALNQLGKHSQAETEYMKAMPSNDAVFNLGNLLRDQERFQEAYVLYVKYLNLNMLTHEQRLKVLVKTMLDTEGCPLNLNSIEHAVLTNKLEIANSLVALRSHDFSSLVSPSDVARQVSRLCSVDSARKDIPKQKRFILITEWFPAECETRREEYLRCLKSNLRNSVIDEIHLLIPVHFANLIPIEHPKLIISITEATRLTFRNAFEYADRFHGFVCIIANADILFDETLNRAEAFTNDGQVIALGRREMDNGKSYVVPRIDSQDAWMFHSPLDLSKSALYSLNFYFGVPRCDNRVAGVLREGGFHLVNPIFDIAAVHVHKSLSRPKAHQVPGKGESITLSLPLYSEY